MKTNKKITAIILTAATVLTFCGCVDISERNFVPETASTGVEAVPDIQAPDENGIGGELLTTKATETPVTITTTETLSALSFSHDQEMFVDSCLFMGDSICSGLGIIGLVDNCYAKAGVAARNIDTFSFDFEGSQLEPLTLLVNSGMKNFVFMMGTNDVNIESAESFTEYYDSFLSKVEALCPDASIYVLSITPVTEYSRFCYNYEIDEFNAALEEKISGSSSSARHYIDVSVNLKDDNGNLKAEYASAEDGVHLSREAYYNLLRAFCTGAGVR